jgi:hypothetical protein
MDRMRVLPEMLPGAMRAPGCCGKIINTCACFHATLALIPLE